MAKNVPDRSEKRWREANSLLDHTSDDATKRQLRRRRRTALLIVAGGFLILVAGSLFFATVVAGSGHHQVHRHSLHPPLWRAVLGLGLMLYGLVVLIVSPVRQIRSGAFRSEWMAPMSVLTHPTSTATSLSTGRRQGQHRPRPAAAGTGYGPAVHPRKTGGPTATHRNGSRPDRTSDLGSPAVAHHLRRRHDRGVSRLRRGAESAGYPGGAVHLTPPATRRQASRRQPLATGPPSAHCSYSSPLLRLITAPNIPPSPEGVRAPADSGIPSPGAR